MSDTAPAVGGQGVTSGQTTTPTTSVPAGDTSSASHVPNAPTDWTSGFPEEIRGYVHHKGFKDAGAVVESYRNMEKLMGVPKDRLFKLPEKDDDPAWGDIHNRLGRPEKPEGYDIKVPDGMAGDFKDWAGKTFHGLGLTKKQGEALANKWNERVTGMVSKDQENRVFASKEQEQTLKRDWGAAYEQNTAIAKKAAVAFGLKAEVVDKLEMAMGFDGVMKFMHDLGVKVGEDKFQGTQGGSGNSFGVMSPYAAKDRIQALRGDPSFVKRYSEGDTAAKEEVARLHQWAYPDTAA